MTTTTSPACVAASVASAARAAVANVNAMADQLAALRENDLAAALARLNSETALLVGAVREAVTASTTTLEAAAAELAGLADLFAAPAAAVASAAAPLSVEDRDERIAAALETTPSLAGVTEVPVASQATANGTPVCQCGEPFPRKGRGYARTCSSCGESRPGC